MQCPVYDLTGLYCMTCGATRAILSLLNGDISTAFRQNALIVLLVPFVVYQLVALMVNRLFGKLLIPLLQMKRRTGWILLAVALTFMVVRNLPVPLAQHLVP